MKESVLSHCERNFVNKCIASKRRLDGRELLEPRDVQIYFGSEWGCCFVSLGQTKTVARVSCDIQKPKTSRPNEGMLYINVELNPLAAQHFESGRQTEMTTFVNRQLEKCFKDSKCVDLESLCIVADKKAWNIRVDISIINHDGNLLDCSAIATLAALAHFHRPDVTTDGVETIIHSFSDKDPLPLTLYYHPICVSFATFENGETVIDPSYIEERVGVAQLTMSVNQYREICSLHCDYVTHTSTVIDVVPSLSNFLIKYAGDLIRTIKDAVTTDIEARYQKSSDRKKSFKDSISTDKVTTMIRERIAIKLTNRDVMEKQKNKDEDMDEGSKEDCKIVVEEDSATLVQTKAEFVGEGGENTWRPESSEDESMSEVEVVEAIEPQKKVYEIELGDSSEEESTETLESKDLS